MHLVCIIHGCVQLLNRDIHTQSEISSVRNAEKVQNKAGKKTETIRRPMKNIIIYFREKKPTQIIQVRERKYTYRMVQNNVLHIIFAAIFEYKFSRLFAPSDFFFSKISFELIHNSFITISTAGYARIWFSSLFLLNVVCSLLTA